MKVLMRSRKFWLAVFGVVQTIVLAYMAVDPEVWASINALVITVIAGIAYEDGKAKEGTDYTTIKQVNEK